MAKTKQAVAVSEPRELSTSLVIDGNTYNINAKSVEKTNHKLTINQIGLNKTTPMEFDGGEAKSIDIVSAQGGRFSGKIAMPSADLAALEADGEMVVNYDDIKNIVLKQFMNNSVLSTWDGTNLSSGGNGANINSVGIITGPDANASDFAQYNKEEKIFAAFIYVADNGMIYFGNSDSSSVTAVQLSAENAVHANEADKLVGTFNNEAVNCTVKDIKFNARDIEEILDGTKHPKTADGIWYEYGKEKGRYDGSVIYSAIQKIDAITETTGSTTTVPVATAAKKLETARTIQTDLSSKNGASFNGTANIAPGVTGTLGTANGGTGQTSLDNVTVGSAKKVYTNGTNTYGSITISTAGPSNNSGNVGDIWIKYS